MSFWKNGRAKGKKIVGKAIYLKMAGLRMNKWKKPEFRLRMKTLACVCSFLFASILYRNSYTALVMSIVHS